MLDILAQEETPTHQDLQNDTEETPPSPLNVRPVKAYEL